MNLNQLKYFTAVAEAKSFTRAGEQFFISQTAITQQIRQLEQTLGCQLFDRRTRPPELTAAGKVFLIEAKAIIERMDKALARTKEASTGISGQIKIGYTKGYERSNLSRDIMKFHREFPNVLVSCFRQSSDMLAAGLLNGEYDIIYTWDSTNLRAEKDIESREIEKVPLVAALYASHPFAHRSVLKREELKGENILYMSPSAAKDSFGDSHFMEMYKNSGYVPNIVHFSSDAESILMMISAEEGISILPDYYTKKLDNADNLVFIPLEGQDEFETIHAIWKMDNSSAALKRLVAYID